MDFSAPSLGALFSILLLFVLAYVCSRIAGAWPLNTASWKRITTAIVLTVCLLLMTITGLGPLNPMIFPVVFYGVFCGIRIMRLGVNRKRWLLGAFVIVWTGLAFIDFATSTGFPLGSRGRNEVAAVGTLRTLLAAEKSFSEKAQAKGIVGPTFATTRKLRTSDLVQDNFTDGKPCNGYLFREIVDPSKKTFLFYAVPAYYAKDRPLWSGLVPMAALWFDGLCRDETRGTGQTSFSVDETGLIRYSRETLQKPITRQQIAQWRLL